jgi:hypothetical protein
MFKTTTLGTPNFVFYDLSTEDLDTAYMADGMKLILDLSKDLDDDEKLARVDVLTNFFDLVYRDDRKNIDLNCGLVPQRHEIVRSFITSYINTFRTLIFDKERTKSFKLDDVIIQGSFFLDITRKHLTWEIRVKAKDGLIPTHQTVAIVRSGFK